MHVHRLHTTGGLALAALLALAVLPTPVRAQIAADGVLDDEVELVLDLNGDGIPDILAGRIGVAFFQIDLRDDGGYPVGPDGFRDAGLRDPDLSPIPPCSILAQCADADYEEPSVRSGVNTGKLTIIYLPDEGGFDPGDPEGTDNSLLYVGMDIFNGDSRILGGMGVCDENSSTPGAPCTYADECIDGYCVGEDTTFHVVDFVNTFDIDDICEDGVMDYNGDGVPDALGLPFDVDSDGDPGEIGRWDPLPGCPTPSLLFDDDQEYYGFTLYECSSLRGFFPTSPIGDVRVVVDNQRTAIEYDIDFPGVTVPETWVESFPDPNDPASDDITDLPALGARDVEFVIRHIDSIIDMRFPDTDFNVDRYRIAQGGVVSRSDADGDSAAEDKIIAEWFLPFARLEVTKEVRCDEEGEEDWRPTTSALPGSRLDFKIEVENTGNIPLAVTLEDVLTGIPLDAAHLDSLVVMLHRPGDAAGVQVTFDEALNLTPPMNPDFVGDPPFDRGFLEDLNGTSSCLGVLNGVMVCDTGGEPIPGDRVVITFSATVDSETDYCTDLTEVDILNAVSASGDPDFMRDTNGNDICGDEGDTADPCPLAPSDPCQIEGNETFDLAGDEVHDTDSAAVDSERENAQGFDDNVVAANAICRDLSFVKEVGIFGDEDSFTTGDVSLDVPTIQDGGSLTLVFRYSGYNLGEIAEDVTITDDFLCADIAAMEASAYQGDFEVLACPLCPTGEATITGVPPYDPLNPDPDHNKYSTVCVVGFTSQDALRHFLGLNDAREDCTADDPSLTDPDPDCYRNCASARAHASDLTGICNDTPDLEFESYATLCNYPCRIEVTKRVRCVDDCTNQNALSNWYDSGTGALPILPGACVQYEIGVENTAFDPAVPICLLRFTDLLLGQSDQIELPDPVVVELEVIGAGGTHLCPVPAGFNVDDTSFTWDPSTCLDALPNGTFDPGDQLFLRFCACVPDTADPAGVDPANDVTVEGASDCEPTLVWGCMASSFVDLDIQECDIEVTKQVSCDEPRLGDGSLNPAAVWEDSVEALPGAMVAFKIEICNAATSEVDLTSIDINDMLDCDDWFEPLSVEADIAGQDVLDCICPSGCIVPDDLNGLKDLSACGPGALAPGSCLTITFEVMVPADFDVVGQAIDCTNQVMVGGFAAEVCAPALACDEASASATINVLIPQPLECEKQVCIDIDADGVCDYGPGEELEIPCDITFPFRLIYDMTVTNPATSETSMMLVDLCDLELVSDADDANLVQISCDLDAVGCKRCGTLAPGASCPAQCVFEVPSRTHWLDFAGRDTDDNPDCYSNTTAGNGDVDPGICDRGAEEPEGAECSARICLVPPCELTVNKRVQCVDNCTDLTAIGDWYDDATGPMPILPGACLRYEIEVENSGADPICLLRFTDLLTEQPGDIELPDPVVVELEVNGVFCTVPAEFNVDGTPFTWDPADCPAACPDGTFDVGDVLFLRFCACIPAEADPVELDPKNTITVNCATCPPLGADPVFCEVDGGKTANVEVDVKECDIEVTKQASCDEPRLGDGITLNPAAVWEDAVEALPGATVAFKIRVCNTAQSEVDITRIDLTDVLDCAEWYVADSVVADINGLDITDCICPGGSCPDFADLSGQKELTDCTPGLITPGECLTITFEVTVPADFDTLGANPDCTNTVTVGSFADMVCSPDTACDEESDSATINVLIPQPLECEKLVCVDTDNDGNCDIDFGTDVEVPCDVEYPFTLIYEMTVTNPAGSETSMVGVKVCDLELISDATNAGLTVVSCHLDDVSGCREDCGTLAPGESCLARCELLVPGMTQWLNFAGRDADANPDCYSNTMTGEGEIDPSLCARGTSGFEYPTCSARVCVVPPCELLVTKRVQCVDNCTSQNPEGNWFESSMPVAPGACVRFEIEVENDGDASICQLTFRDLLTEVPGDISAPTPGTVELEVNGVACPVPAGFNVNDTGFDWDPGTCPAACPDGTFNAGDVLVLRFCTCVRDTANPAPLDPVNTVTVQCATCPASGADPVLCGDGETDQVAVDIKKCDIEVTKDVSCDEPRLPDGTQNPAAVWEPAVDVLPGTAVAFRIQVCNTAQSEVDITSVDISDTLSRVGWFEAGSIVADIGDVDVTPCIAPGGGATLSALNGLKDLTACGPGAIAPGECLTITFMINVPSGYVLTGQDVDCRNDVTVDGITDICAPEGPCDTGTDFATINVLVPSVECDKLVCADFNTDGICETAFMSVLNLEDNDVDYPVQVIYQFTVRNLGETPLKEVVLCDADFLTDVLGLPAGVTFASCELDETPGAHFGCRDFPAGLALDAAESFQCVLRVASEDAWDAFKMLDGVYTPPGDPDGDLCYNNEATVTAEADLEQVDACGPDDPILLESTCSAQVCLSPICIPPPCPPMTKIMFDIWNMNEVKFSGTEYCTWSWDETLMSQIAPPNHFLLTALQTNKGQARINGVQSDTVCGADTNSQSVPLLGVAAKMIAFDDDHGMAGMPLVGFGDEEGFIGTGGAGSLPQPGTPGTPSVTPPAVDAGGVSAGTPTITDGRTYYPDPEHASAYPPETNGARSINRGNISEKGSLLVFPKFEVKWDAEGNVIQDTFVELTNDWVTDVTVQLYFVDGDMCVWVDNKIVLTGNEPTYWSVATGHPKGMSPITVLGDGCPDRDGDNPGGRRIRGYILAWAVGSGSGLEIRWNHLTGRSTIVHYGWSAAWEYSAYSFRALRDVPNGEYLYYPLGTLELNGVEYDAAPDFLLLDFYAPGAVLESTRSPLDAIIEDTDLTFWAAYKDFSP